MAVVRRVRPEGPLLDETDPFPQKRTFRSTSNSALLDASRTAGDSTAESFVKGRQRQESPSCLSDAPRAQLPLPRSVDRRWPPAPYSRLLAPRPETRRC